MTRTTAVNRARFAELFKKEPWTAVDVVQQNVYMSKMEFNETMVRHHLGRFLIGQQLTYRSPRYRFHIIMVPEIMEDEAFKAKVQEIMDIIGVNTTFSKTCNRGNSSYVIGKVKPSEVELIEYCDITVFCR